MLTVNINVQFAYHSDAALVTEIFHASYFLPVSQFMNSGLRRLKPNRVILQEIGCMDTFEILGLHV